MNSTARSVVVTLFLLGALASSGLVSILTNPAGPIAASDRVVDPVKTKKDTPADPGRPAAVAPTAIPGIAGLPAANPAEALPQSGPQAPLVQQNPTQGPITVVPATPLADAPATLGVRLSSDGLLPGRLNLFDSETGIRKPTKNITISFLQGGKVIAQVTPGVSGVFQVKDLPTGIYSMVASGTDGFLAIAVLVLPPLSKPGEILADNDPLQIDVDVVHPVNMPLVRMMIRERLYPSGVVAPAPTKTATVEAWLKERGKPMRTPTIQLDADGGLQTRFNWISADAAGRTPATDSVAYLIRDGVIAAKSEVTAEGLGRFTGTLSPGSYSLLVAPAPTAIVPANDGGTTTRAGRRGYGAVGIMVTAADAPATVDAATRRNPMRLVSATRLLQGAANSIDIPSIDLVPIEDIEGAVTGSSDGLGGNPAGLAGAPPARAPGGGGGGGAGGGSDLTPLLVGGGIAGLLAAGSNLGSSNVSASANANSGGGGDGGGGGGSPKAIK